MKKIISAVLVLISILTLTACTKYKPQPSTKEEAETVLTLTYEGINYDVPYEVYRTFFLNRRSEIDKGDLSVWSGAEKDKYIKEIESVIIPEIADIYSVFHLCYKNGIDVYSKIVEESIEDYITVSVEGGELDGMLIDGHGGNYNAYLESLKKLNMNYSVQKLLFRYAVCTALLDAYYKDKSGDDTLKYTKEDVRKYYDDENTVRVIYNFFDRSTPISEEINTDERVAKLRAGLLERAGDENAVASYIIAETSLTEDVRNGMVISNHSLDGTYYAELIEAALELGMHAVSEPITLNSGAVEGVYLLYRTDKSSEPFEKCYSEIENAYISETIGMKLAQIRSALVDSAVKSSALTGRDYSAIGM